MNKYPIMMKIGGIQIGIKRKIQKKKEEEEECNTKMCKYDYE